MFEFNSIAKKSLLILIILCGMVFTVLYSTPYLFNNQKNGQKHESTSKDIENVIKAEHTKNLSDDDFIIKSAKTYIKLAETIYEMKIDDKVISHKPVNEKRAYELYYYENFTLSVALDNTICSIILSNPDYETVRGVKVGDNVSKIFEEYGETSFTSYDIDNTYGVCTGFYMYHYNTKHLIFYVDEYNKIVRIELNEL